MSAVTSTQIQKSPDVMGGEACIRDTRIPVWVLVGYRKIGVSDTRMLDFYPALNSEDLTAAWEYYGGHIAEIEDAIRRNEEDSERG